MNLCFLGLNLTLTQRLKSRINATQTLSVANTQRNRALIGLLILNKINELYYLK